MAKLKTDKQHKNGENDFVSEKLSGIINKSGINKQRAYLKI